jgi:hypothetical protein
MMLHRIRDFLLVDRPLLYALSGRLWQVIAGPITIYLLLHHLTLAEQGIYYALVGLASLQNIFELGYLNVLISQASHLAGKPARKAGSLAIGVADDSPPRERAILAEPSSTSPALDEPGLSSLICHARRWFAWVSVGFFLSALLAGEYLFRQQSEAIAWRGPMIGFLLLAAINFYLAPSASILEGIGRRRQIYGVQLAQMVSGSLAVWLAFLGGAKLWALVASCGVQLGWMCYLIGVIGRDVFRPLGAARSPRAVSVGEAGSFFRIQWRAAVYSLSLYLATQLFVVVIVRWHGSEEAGRIGMSLSIAQIVQMSALAWLQTKYAVAAKRHGQGARSAAGSLWRRATLVSAMILATGLLGLIGVLAWLPWLDARLATRLITPWQLAIYAVGCLANHLLAAQTFYVLSRKSAPLAVAAAIGLGTVALSVVVGGYFFANTGALAGYSLAMLVVCLPLHTWSYYRFRRAAAA